MNVKIQENALKLMLLITISSVESKIARVV